MLQARQQQQPRHDNPPFSSEYPVLDSAKQAWQHSSSREGQTGVSKEAWQGSSNGQWQRHGPEVKTGEAWQGAACSNGNGGGGGGGGKLWTGPYNHTSYGSRQGAAESDVGGHWQCGNPPVPATETAQCPSWNSHQYPSAGGGGGGGGQGNSFSSIPDISEGVRGWQRQEPVDR